MEQRSAWLNLTNQNGRLLTNLMVNTPPNHNSLKDYSLHQINNGDNHRLSINCTELIKQGRREKRHELNQNVMMFLSHNIITDINNDMEFIVRIQQLSALCHLIKQKHGLHKYTKISSTIIHYYTYLLIQSKVKLTDTETQHPHTRIACTSTLVLTL